MIRLSVPDGFQADEVTVTLRRIPTIIKDLPLGQDHLLSDGQKPAKSKLREPWEPGEISYLMENYSKLPKKDIARYLGRSISACHTKYWETMKKNGTLSKKGRHQWTAEDDAYLIKNEGTCEEQAAHLGVSVQRVWAHRFELKEKGLMSLVSSKKGWNKPKSKWTDEANLYLVENKGTKEEQAAHLGVTVRALECQRSILRKKGVIIQEQTFREPDSPPFDPGYNDSGPDLRGGDIRNSSLDTMLIPEKDVEEKEPLWREALNLFKRTPDLPEDFRPNQKFERGCYIWHQAAKEIGKWVRTEGDFCIIEFKHDTKKFMRQGCRTMYEAMMVFAQDRNA